MMFLRVTIAALVVNAISFNSVSQTLDIKPDCSERPIKIEEIVSIAEKPEIKTVIQFLQRLPKDSLQTFTFVPTTNSLQHHKVDEIWPRVLRLSADGKIAMSFVCNPESQDYGGVEILHFEESPVARWRSLSLKFDTPETAFKGLTASSLTKTNEPRLLRNSATCLKCHGIGVDRADLRPIFSAYPNWPGFFGSEDDTLFYSEREFSNFQQFKSAALQNPCFQTLPWPKKVPKGYEHYPYHALGRPSSRGNPYTNQAYIRELKTTNYHVRPNLKFTDTFSHLLARRLTSRFLQQKDYHRVAPLLAMESLACENLDLDSELGKLLGRRYKKPAFIEGMSIMDPRSSNSKSMRLYTVAGLLGIKPDEWTLSFNRPHDPEFATGVQGAYGNDNSVARLTQSLLLQELTTSIPKLTGNFKLSRGVSEFFKGQDFSCIDDLGGAIEFDSIEKQKNMCEALAKAHQEKIGETRPLLAKTTTLVDTNVSPKLSAVRAALSENFKQAPASLKSEGEKLAQTYCTSCHGNTSYLPANYHFLNSKSSFKKAVEADPLLLFRVMAYTESGRMPLRHTLKESEKHALQFYLFKTAGGPR